ncbi:hypothetical protein [Aquimarina litoralis]|uniref:hypothetical protein n=1 Tax=Aquimarina litoralis TaxID=584605 RepID=UPI001C580E1D|nr:hypothetical protein [Aquimarina litoralis]MBW1294666.1 hypothetical protein [Aquimarina litoralis]
MNNLLSLKGSEKLSKQEQVSISGGRGSHRRCGNSVPQIAVCVSNHECPTGTICCPNGNCSAA